MKKYWAILTTRTQEDMAYRANYFIGALFRFLPLVTSIVLWYAVFKSMGGTHPKIEGMSYQNLIAYTALVYISRGVSSMPGMTRDICNDIKDGNLNRYIVRPINYSGYQIVYRLAHKLVFWLIAAVTFPVIFFLLRHDFTHQIQPEEWVAFIIALIIGFWIGMLFSLTIGLLAFWFLEISTFLYVISTIEYFLSGNLIPLNLFGPKMFEIVGKLPFSYEAFWPVLILLGKVAQHQLVSILLWGIGWVFFFLIVINILWFLGIRRYSAVGG